MIEQSYRKRNRFSTLLSDLFYQPFIEPCLGFLGSNTNADDYKVDFTVSDSKIA